MSDSFRERGGGGKERDSLMPLFKIKQQIMKAECVISFSAPFIIISPATIRKRTHWKTLDPQPGTSHWNLYLLPAIKIKYHHLKMRRGWRKSDVWMKIFSAHMWDFDHSEVATLPCSCYFLLSVTTDGTHAGSYKLEKIHRKHRKIELKKLEKVALPAIMLMCMLFAENSG